MSLTQLAGMYLGTTNTTHLFEKMRGLKSSIGNIIHITDGINNDILAIITAKHVIDNNHEQALENNYEMFDATVLGGQNYDKHIIKGNRIIIPDEDKHQYKEFTIDEVEDRRGGNGKIISFRAHASFLNDIKKANVISPNVYENYTARELALNALINTGYDLNFVESNSRQTVEFENHLNPYDMLKQICTKYELEPSFKIEISNNKIVKRYVDLVVKQGKWDGIELTFGRNLQGITRIENGEIYTALVGLGPEGEDGNRPEVFVEDLDALKRWGTLDSNGDQKHLIGLYEPQSERQDMTMDELRQYTQTELNKRINATISYEASFVDLEYMLDDRNKKIRFGDTIRIKEITYEPPLYVEARVRSQKRDVVTNQRKEIELGDYREYNANEIHDIYNLIKRQQKNKASIEMLKKYAEPKKILSDEPPSLEGRTEHVVWVDTSKQPYVSYVVNNGQWEKMSPSEPSDIGAYNKQEVDDRTQRALDDAKAFAENAENISKGVIDVGAVPIRSSMTGARLDWDGVNGLVQYNNQEEATSWLDLEGQAYFSNATVTGRIEAKTGYFGDNMKLEQGGLTITRADGAEWMRNGMVSTDYAVSGFDPHYMDLSIADYADGDAFTAYNGFYSAVKGTLDGRGISGVDAGYQDVRNSSYRYTVRFQRYEFVHSARYLKIGYRIANNNNVGRHRVSVYEEQFAPPEGYPSIDWDMEFPKGTTGIRNLVIDLGIPTYQARAMDFRIGWNLAWGDKDEIVRFRINRVIQTDEP